MIRRCEVCGTLWIIYSNGPVIPGLGDAIVNEKDLCKECESRRKAFMTVYHPNYREGENVYRWYGGSL